MMFGGFMGIFWIVLIVGAFFLINGMVQQKDQSVPQNRDTAWEILKKRYAEGEIGKEEFEQKKMDLFSP